MDTKSSFITFSVVLVMDASLLTVHIYASLCALNTCICGLFFVINLINLINLRYKILKKIILKYFQCTETEHCLFTV